MTTRAFVFVCAAVLLAVGTATGIRLSAQQQAQAPGHDGQWHSFGDKAPAADPASNSECAVMPNGAALEQDMLRLVNADRSDTRYRDETNGAAAPLRWNATLATVARCHSLDMMRNAYFDHNDRNGTNPGSRIERAGLTWSAFAENIALSLSVQQAESMMMSEPAHTQNHRANILDRRLTEIGIGVVGAPDGRLYVTQDFLTPR